MPQINIQKQEQITDKNILKKLKEKDEYVAEQQNILKEMEELEERFNKNMSTVKAIDEQVRPKILKKVKNLDLGEFEDLSRVHKDEDGNWYMEFTDRLEEFKRRWRENNSEEEAK